MVHRPQSISVLGHYKVRYISKLQTSIGTGSGIYSCMKESIEFYPRSWPRRCCASSRRRRRRRPGFSSSSSSTSSSATRSGEWGSWMYSLGLMNVIQRCCFHIPKYNGAHKNVIYVIKQALKIKMIARLLEFDRFVIYVTFFGASFWGTRKQHLCITFINPLTSYHLQIDIAS